MARTTVEDCLDKIPNRYKLVLLAGKRAQQINQMARLMIGSPAHEADKPTVAALREIAAGTVTIDNVDSMAPAGSRDRDIAVNDAFVNTDQDGGRAEMAREGNPWVATTDTIKQDHSKDETGSI